MRPSKIQALRLKVVDVMMCVWFQTPNEGGPVPAHGWSKLKWMFTQYLGDFRYSRTKLRTNLMFTYVYYVYLFSHSCCFTAIPYPFGEHRFQGLHRPSHGTALVAAASVEAVGAGFADAWTEKGGEPVQGTLW